MARFLEYCTKLPGVSRKPLLKKEMSATAFIDILKRRKIE